MGRSGEKAVVVLKTVNSVTEEELILYARQQLANYKFSKSVDFMTELPKSGPEKILKRDSCYKCDPAASGSFVYSTIKSALY